ncbi:MAG: cysteine desulfurase family protein [Coriobacteriia bacterium]|nr:cysteine desulfurase family protein [Coriobacteriia bacterium]
MREVYLDQAASMLMIKPAIDALKDYYEKAWAGANANSLHSYGRKNAQAFEGARKQIAQALGAHRPSEIIVTGGGTESDNFALLGLAQAQRQKDKKRNKVIMSNFEHEAVSQSSLPLKALGFEVQEVQCDAYGFIQASALEEMLDEEVALVSIMLVNNELGTVQDVARLAKLAHAYGAKFHTDAVQGFCHVPFNAEESGVDAASVTAHKIGGPVGIGALYVRRGTAITPFLYGGGQEHGKRSGSLDVAGLLAFGAAAEYQSKHFEENYQKISKTSKLIYERLLAHPDLFERTLTPVEGRQYHPGYVSIFCKTKLSSHVLLALDEKGFYVSAGSACHASSTEGSHTLVAIGASAKQMQSVMRITFDERLSEDDAQAFCDELISLCQA